MRATQSATERPVDASMFRSCACRPSSTVAIGALQATVLPVDCDRGARSAPAAAFDARRMHRAKEEEHQPDEDDHPDQEPERTSPPFLGGIAEGAVVGAGFGYRAAHHTTGARTTRDNS